ncbi:hypothetical protein A2U01_0074306, partial [Trifolium medium]|nr:hypothetical protein [Trifolium medium]
NLESDFNSSSDENDFKKVLLSFVINKDDGVDAKAFTSGGDEDKGTNNNDGVGK